MVDDKKVKIIIFINQYTVKNHYSPSQKEIMQGTGINGRSGLQSLLESMQYEGLLEFTHNRPRSLFITEKGKSILREYLSNVIS